ncbi:hypothetical protein BC829DRAFT_407014, partial [Chytridium lagenaria]
MRLDSRELLYTYLVWTFFVLCTFNGHSFFATILSLLFLFSTHAFLPFFSYTFLCTLLPFVINNEKVKPSPHECFCFLIAGAWGIRGALQGWVVAN